MKDKILNEIIENTSKLIEYKTIKDNYDEIDKALNYIKKELSNYYIKTIQVGNYNNLVISNTKSKNLDIIFYSHVDVVPSKTYESIIEDGLLYGRGSFDMKGQLSVIISLLKNNKINKKIAFIITSDEEIGGYCCKEILKDYNAKFAVMPDAGKNFNVVIEEKGLLQLELSLDGKTSHASEPFNGINPIIGLMDVYNKLLEIYPMPKNKDDFITSINLSKFNSGDAVNMVPGNAKMTLDIRFTKDNTIEQIIKSIKKINKDVDIKILDQGPMFNVDENNPYLIDFINKAENIIGKKIRKIKCLATSDAIYFSEKNIPTILMNPIGNYWHGPNEYVNIESLYTLYLIYKTII